jgi:D-lactate dehydrogenase
MNEALARFEAPSIAFFDVGLDDQRALSALCPPDWRLRFHESIDIDPNTPELTTTQVLCVFVRTGVTRQIIDAMPNLALVTTRSTGLDHIDLQACRERGVVVSGVADYGSGTVAEHTFALLLAIARRVCEARARANQGSFSYRGLTGFDLEGKTLGIVGCGRIGQHMLRIARGFGMELLAFDPAPMPGLASGLGVRYVSWSELLQRSDVISLHVPLNTGTHHLLDGDAFAQMKPGVVLLNTARGALIDSSALVRALESETVAAAGLDVLEEEDELSSEAPMGCGGLGCDRGWSPAPHHALLGHPRVLVTPHIGFNSREAVVRILDATVANIAAWQRDRSGSEAS